MTKPFADLSRLLFLRTAVVTAYVITMTGQILSVFKMQNTRFANKVHCSSVILVSATNSKAELSRSLVTATAAIAGLSSFLFGFLTNMPVALAPGMGLNAYFAYQIVGYHGDGIISYNLALTAVFIEGFVFVFLSLIGMRQW
jgi:xanthine/uracil/vitamin C permease (AzgA family)